jgi:peptidoglycan/LPS O-acetylase OafA/YrhL
MAAPTAGSRSWTADRWVPGLDPLRGIAAGAVLLHHIGQQLFANEDVFFAPLRAWLAVWGVTLFFFVSGFCIHLPQAWRAGRGQRVEPVWSQFARQRLRRLGPAYFVALCLSALVGSWSPTLLVTRPTWHSLITHALFIHTWTGESGSINAVLWSIGVEMHLYAMYPVLLWLRRRFGLGWTTVGLYVEGLLLFVLLTALARRGHPELGELTSLFLVSWWKWSAGAWLAEVYVSGTAPQPLRSALTFRGAPAVWLVVALGMAYFDPVVYGVHVKWWLLPFGCLMMLGSWVVHAFQPSVPFKALAAVGLWSYSLYLFHPVVIAVLVPLVGHLPAAVQAIAYFATAIAAAWLLYETVERRTMRPRTVPAVAVS